MTAARLPRTSPPGLVVFDVDGTLQDTCLWWPKVLRQGLAAFAAERGFVARLPDDAAANAVIGKRDAEVWGAFLPPEHHDLWPDLRAAVVPVEAEVVRGGADFAFPRARALLGILRAAGVTTALASNCRQTYFAAVREGLGLAYLTDWQFCLDSPGVTCKADMLAAAMTAAGTRDAVMVGDRESDLEAARAHDLAFVWRRTPFCAGLAADAEWKGDVDAFLRIIGLATPRLQ
ncbi:MAG: HAD family hydrolase [Planctomycetota bacterium]